jgi:hypothetical protein
VLRQLAQVLLRNGLEPLEAIGARELAPRDLQRRVHDRALLGCAADLDPSPVIVRSWRPGRDARRRDVLLQGTDRLARGPLHPERLHLADRHRQDHLRRAQADPTFAQCRAEARPRPELARQPDERRGSALLDAEDLPGIVAQVEPQLREPIAGPKCREPLGDREVERRPGAGRRREPALALVRVALAPAEPFPELAPRVRAELEARRCERRAACGGSLAGARVDGERGAHTRSVTRGSDNLAQ